MNLQTTKYLIIASMIVISTVAPSFAQTYPPVPKEGLAQIIYQCSLALLRKKCYRCKIEKETCKLDVLNVAVKNRQAIIDACEADFFACGTEVREAARGCNVDPKETGCGI